MSRETHSNLILIAVVCAMVTVASYVSQAAVVATNPWSANSLGPTVIPTGALAVTPSDTDELTQVCRALEATVAGNIAVVFVDGTSATLVFGAGERKTGFFKQVKSTATTATGIIALKFIFPFGLLLPLFRARSRKELEALFSVPPFDGGTV